MKKIYIILSLLMLSLPIVSGYTDNLISIIKIHDCKNLTINVSGVSPVHETEYYFPRCDETSFNRWNCNCTGNSFTVIMSIKEYAENAYILNLSYFHYQNESYSENVTEQKSYYNLSSRMFRSISATTSTTTTTEKVCPICNICEVCESCTTTSTEMQSTTTTIMQEETSNKFWAILLLILAVLPIAYIIYSHIYLRRT